MSSGVLGALLDFLKSQWILLIVIYFVTRAVFRKYFSSVSDVPSISFLATISRLGKVREVLSGKTEINQLEAHRKYGKIVRIGPNEVSISDPSCIPIIYDNGQKFKKTDFYEIFGFPTPADKNTFSETDPTQHLRMKRNIASAYSMSSLVSLEQFVDSTLALLLQRLSELSVSPGTAVAQRGEPVNLVQWFQWYAFDVIGELSFSRRLGFLDSKSDVGGTCKLLDQFIAYTSAVAMIPEMHKYLLGNPYLKYIATPPASIIADITASEISNRDENPDLVHNDLVEKIMSSQKKNPESFPPEEILRHASVNVSAGSETTGITLDALAYYLLKNPSCYQKLQDEIDAAHEVGKLSELPRFKETNHEAMPYLAACIKEIFRIHPPVSLTLPRHVPKGGVEMCGRFFPEGTRVGISAYVVGRDRGLFGEDADVFRPERWLECSKEKMIAMENGCLHFSYGARMCVGRHIAMIEICKMFPAIMRKFRFELVEPEMEWEILNYTFLKPRAINVWVVAREQ